MVPLRNRHSSGCLFSSALTDCLYKSLDCFNRTDDKLLPTCGFSFVPALLGFPWLYFVIGKGVGILKSCFSQMLETKGNLVMHISFWRRLIHQLGSLPFKSSLWLALCFSVCGGANLLEKPDPLLCTRLWLHKSAQSGQRQALVVLSGTHSESRRGRQALLLCLPDPWLHGHVTVSKISMDGS